jgi:hypothetical protein
MTLVYRRESYKLPKKTARRFLSKEQRNYSQQTIDTASAALDFHKNKKTTGIPFQLFAGCLLVNLPGREKNNLSLYFSHE